MWTPILRSTAATTIGLFHAVVVTTLFVHSLDHFDGAEEITKVTFQAINGSKFWLCQL